MDKLMEYFDKDKSGKISLDEFVRGIRVMLPFLVLSVLTPQNQGNMNKDRKLLVREAFQRLDRTGDGFVTVADLSDAYDASHHPDVLSGKLEPEEVLRDFLDVYQKNGDMDDVVTWPEFLDYYKVSKVYFCEICVSIRSF